MKVFVEGANMGIVNMFQRRGWVHSLVDEADLIVFSGGADVSPSLYGETPHPKTMSSKTRDLYCLQIYAYARRRDIPMSGICRGGQFLNVINGGKMYQHVNKHAIGDTHNIKTDDGRNISVTSTHHQMMIPADHAVVLATARESTARDRYLSNHKLITETGAIEDTEVLYYEDSNCLCYQPHPEYVPDTHECQEYYFELLNDYLGVTA